MLKKVINSFFNNDLNLKLYLIDNSPTDALKILATDERIEYYHNTANDGFGKGHNIGIRKAAENCKYHLILNPDIYFDGNTLREIINKMDADPQIGILMPKVLYPDGSMQNLAKLLPTPFDLFFRRFIPLTSLKNKLVRNYEMQQYKYDKEIEVPFLSGCFMFCRLEVLLALGGFDENIFMYTEDIDLCRRTIELGYKTIVFPFVSVYHDHERKSFRNYATLKVYIKSALYYFNKWGWLVDKKRSKINKKALKQLE